MSLQSFDTPYLTEALAAASQRIRNKCGWHIFPEISEIGYRVQARSGFSAWLPTVYLVSVDAVVRESAIDIDTITWFRDGRVDGIPDGVWTLTFTHGYEEAPDDIVDLTLALAMGDLIARGVVREQSLSSSITWARASGQLTAVDVDELSAYKIGYQP